MEAETLQCGDLFGALALAQGEMRGALKDATGQIGQQKTKYADLASCWDACRDALAKHSIAVVQIPAADGARVTVRTILGHKSGQYIAGELIVTSVGSTPQQIGSAITYARRYSLCSMVGIAPEDDDGAAASGTGAHAGSKEAQQRVAKQLIEESAKPSENADAKPKGGKKSVDFEMLKKFKTAKGNLGDADYYRILRSYGAEHANDIADPEQAKKCLRAMAGWLNVSEPWTRIEQRDKERFAALLTAEGFASIADALASPESAAILLRLELAMSVQKKPREVLAELETANSEAYWRIIGSQGIDVDEVPGLSIPRVEELIVLIQAEIELGA